MATLHSVNKSPLSSNTLDSCLRLLQPGDGLLLIEDGVYGADRAFAERFPENVELFVLTPDVDARGLAARLNDRFSAVNDQAFVELVVRFDKSQSWY